MSRSEEQWADTRRDAMKIRDLISDAIDMLEGWPIEFDDTAPKQRESIESALRNVYDDLHTVVGSLTWDWLEDTGGNHCCRQFADLSGFTIDEIEKVGSCGCMQAKEEVKLIRKDIASYLRNQYKTDRDSGDRKSVV